MNTANTNNVRLSPPLFQDGLQVWSSGDGTINSDSYHNAANAALVPADQDFGSCLELLKTTGEQRLRYMGKTPISPGRYLKITARVKAISVGPDRWLGGNNRRCKSALGDPSGATDRASGLWKRGRGLCNCWLGPATRGGYGLGDNSTLWSFWS